MRGRSLLACCLLINLSLAFFIVEAQQSRRTHAPSRAGRTTSHSGRQRRDRDRDRISHVKDHRPLVSASTSRHPDPSRYVADPSRYVVVKPLGHYGAAASNRSKLSAGQEQRHEQLYPKGVDSGIAPQQMPRPYPEELDQKLAAEYEQRPAALEQRLAAEHEQLPEENEQQHAELEQKPAEPEQMPVEQQAPPVAEPSQEPVDAKLTAVDAKFTAADDDQECPPGYYKSSGSCKLCPIGTFADNGRTYDCDECPAGHTTRREGSTSIKECVCPPGVFGPQCDECPKNLVLLEYGKCGCRPGYGGPTCDKCEPGFYSLGGSPEDPTPHCRPCGAHLTSPPGAVSAEYCECEAGYGADRTDVPMEDRQCVPCALGTYNPGNVAARKYSASPAASTQSSVGIAALPTAHKISPGVPKILACQSCSARNPEGSFTTVDVGSDSISQCICQPGHGGLKCTPCDEGTFSVGGKDAMCQSCPYNGLGFTTMPKIGAASVTDCMCRPGYGMTETGACKRCPADTFSASADKDECQPCPFGTTSAPGAKSINQCRSVAQLCPVGQTAPLDAVSRKECGCYPGYGSAGGGPDAPCTICPSGTWAHGGDLEACKPCHFGHTSPVGATSEEQCYPINVCPAGTELPPFARGVSTQECMCKPGYGSPTGEGPCHVCRVGTYSEGRTLEDCKTCPFSTTSVAGATSKADCLPVAQQCPVGQVAPPHAFSPDQCGCLPGYGGGVSPRDACTICPGGTFATGGDTQPCRPCKFGYTSPVGSTSEDQCYPTNACPVGTVLETYADSPASIADCVCKAGYGSSTGSAGCQLCPVGTYAVGGGLEACMPCPFGTTSAAGSSRKEHCKTSPQSCPIGQWAPENAVSREQCVCYPGFGAGDAPNEPCKICPPGTFSDGRLLEKCQPCGFGFTSPEGATSQSDCRPIDQCPAGTALKWKDEDPARFGTSEKECTCKPGYGSSSGAGTCRLCGVGTYSEGGSMEDCKPCPLGYTSGPGTDSVTKCVKVPQVCPAGQIAPPDAVSPDQCACMAGFGGGNSPSDPCTLCPTGSWSPGGARGPCIPCGWGFTSVIGSTSDSACYATNACPAGTEVHQSIAKASSLADCVCKAGYGAIAGSSLGVCQICPAGTYSAGGDMDTCQPCGFGKTSPPGSTGPSKCVSIAQACPAGQFAPAGAVSAEQCACQPGFGGGDRPTDPCKICPAGTYSPGGTTDACIPCGFGFTSAAGSTDADACKEVDACPAGTMYNSAGGHTSFTLSDCVCKPGYGSRTGSGPCHLCPANTFSNGHNLEDCKPCPFGFTSGAGAESEKDCRPVAHVCPIGQYAPEDAVSEQECRCYSGFGGGNKPEDPCEICPPGTFSANVGTDKCLPCPAGHTSPEGSDSSKACYLKDQCPAGTELVGPSSTQSCKCKPGYGSSTGSAPCHLCPAGTFSDGSTLEDCRPCPWGHTSKAGASSADECVKVPQPCPPGQVAPPGAVSAQQCACVRGYGVPSGHKPEDGCTVCPIGSWSPGGSLESCISCGFAFTSPAGSSAKSDCYAVNACPLGTEVHRAVQTPRSVSDCVCKAGYGASPESTSCRLCPPNTYASGGDMDVCKDCPEGTSSEAGATGIKDCIKVEPPPPKIPDCPSGTEYYEREGQSSGCVCKAGYGSSKNGQGCAVCAKGTYSPGGTNQECIPCPENGKTREEGSTSFQHCRPDKSEKYKVRYYVEDPEDKPAYAESPKEDYDRAERPDRNEGSAYSMDRRQYPDGHDEPGATYYPTFEGPDSDADRFEQPDPYDSYAPLDSPGYYDRDGEPSPDFVHDTYNNAMHDDRPRRSRDNNGRSKRHSDGHSDQYGMYMPNMHSYTIVNDLQKPAKHAAPRVYAEEKQPKAETQLAVNTTSPQSGAVTMKDAPPAANGSASSLADGMKQTAANASHATEPAVTAGDKDKPAADSSNNLKAAGPVAGQKEPAQPLSSKQPAAASESKPAEQPPATVVSKETQAPRASIEAKPVADQGKKEPAQPLSSKQPAAASESKPAEQPAATVVSKETQAPQASIEAKPVADQGGVKTGTAANATTVPSNPAAASGARPAAPA